MDTSYGSSGTNSLAISRPRREPEVTLDDVSAVVAGLNDKVMQLRREILALKASSESRETDGRPGYRVEEDEIKVRDPRAINGQDNITRRKKTSSEAVRLNSKSQNNKASLVENGDRSSSSPFWSDGIVRTKRNSSRETRRNSSNVAKPRQSLTREFEQRGSNEEATRRRTTSGSLGRIRKNSKNETTQTYAQPKRKSRESAELIAGKTALETLRNDIDSYNRKISHNDEKGRGREGEISRKSDTLKKRDEKIKSSEERNDGRIILPSRASMECQGIRHALGLSTAYCDCNSAGSAVRRVRRKRISRGVQCDRLNDKKEKTSRGLGGCFAFKCCLAKSGESKQKIPRKTDTKSKSAEPSDAYRLKDDRDDERKSRRSRENGVERNQKMAKSIENHRLGGGAETKNPQHSKRDETILRGFLENTKHPNPRGTGLQNQEANDVKQVRRRLNECLLELNGIIGDVGYIFKNNNE